MKTENQNETEFKTPMMKQYLEIKKEYPDCLLFFRMGDFYELFLEDAEIGSEILDITLTARSKGSDGKIPMCGVPYHSVDSYLAKIIKAGKKAAICEQVSKPSPGNELVERKVVRIVTPGTIVDDALLDSSLNNFLLTFQIFGEKIVFAYTDISTGEFFVFEKNHPDNKNKKFTETIINEIKRLNPSEVILDATVYENYELLRSIQENTNANIFPFQSQESTEIKKSESATLYLKKFFQVKSLSSFNISNENFEIIKTSAFLLKYLEHNLKGHLSHINKINLQKDNQSMHIDPETINNLELFETNRIGIGKNQKISLFKVLDGTKTAMGKRQLQNWMLFPLTNKTEIEKRQKAVYEIIMNRELQRYLSDSLNQITDIERITSRIATNRANARDLISLANTLHIALEIIKNMKDVKSINDFISQDAANLLAPIIELINIAINPDAPTTLKDGGLINSGYNEKLDSMKNEIRDSKEWIAELEMKEKERTKIPNLKVGYNSVFGYYIEITKSYQNLTPDNYIRKQTLVNAERFITQELKEKETIVISAEEKINELEFEIFENLISQILIESENIQNTSKIIANIDCLFSFAQKASELNYTLPTIHEPEKFICKIEEGRHPVIEQSLHRGDFTPNSIELNNKNYIHLITGPNMAGKSTYIRQTALIQLMAQIGSFVPAHKAEISIVDGIYTRIGAGDALAQGLSTFMVEMIETAKILNNATEHSLIILDEVGRGTSTIDGLSIAKAIIEYLHNKIKAKTLFATHFHELVFMEQKLKNLHSYHVLVSEDNNEIKFMHKVEPGGTDKSYGIEVAKLAGVPKEVIDQAKYYLDGSSVKQLNLQL